MTIDGTWKFRTGEDLPDMVLIGARLVFQSSPGVIEDSGECCTRSYARKRFGMAGCERRGTPILIATIPSLN